jgi:hypothetical protein
MAKKPNYNFEKRQKELAKKAKKEEKKQRKLLGLDTAEDEGADESGETEESDE